MKKLSVLLLIIILLIISIVVIIVKGNTFVIKIDNISNIKSDDELNIIIEKDIIKCTDKKIENGSLFLKIESISKGKTFIDIVNKDNEFIGMYSIYVHNFGIITFNSFLGNSSGSIIVPISILILLVYIIILLIKKYKNDLNQNMYQYKNIVNIGIIIFLVVALIDQSLSIVHYNGFINTIKYVIGLFNSFSILLLPFAFFTSILVTISNIILVKKEGLKFRNILGIILGLVFCFFTIFPDLLNNYLQGAKWIDIHNEEGIARYIHEFVETSIFVVVSYLECILIGTIIIAVKTAKHIPEYDKDYIIILGCKIKKDGTLTNLLEGRVKKAIEFRNNQLEKMGKDLVFIASGGKGIDEVISEAKAIENYLIENGIEKEKIIVEDNSKNTFENLRFSNSIIKEKKENAKIAFSTTNYHVYRAGVLAAEQGIKAEGIGAKTKTYFWINAFIREYIATLFSEKKIHIIMISLIMLITLFMIMIMYWSNLL